MQKSCTTDSEIPNKVGLNNSDKSRCFIWLDAADVKSAVEKNRICN